MLDVHVFASRQKRIQQTTRSTLKRGEKWLCWAGNPLLFFSFAHPQNVSQYLFKKI
jgi:hypothetical protein